MSLVIEYGEHRVEIVWIGIHPGIDVFWLHVDDRALVAFSSDLRFRLIGDGCKTIQVRFYALGVCPFGPQAGDIHGLAGTRPEMDFLVDAFTHFHLLIKCLSQHKAMRIAELIAPKTL